MIASENGHAEVVKALIEASGVDVKAPGPGPSWTPLMIASDENGHTKVEKALLDAKAFLNTGAGDESQSGGQKPKR